MNLNSRPEIKINIGDRELVMSAIIHLEGPEPVVVNISNLRVTLVFKTDSEGPRYTGSVEDGGLRLDLYNHTNPIGEGKLTPFEVAIVGGRKLYMTYVSSTMDASADARRLELAFYLGPANV